MNTGARYLPRYHLSHIVTKHLLQKAGQRRPSTLGIPDRVGRQQKEIWIGSTVKYPAQLQAH